jgi:prefoldin subunit 5
MTIDTNIDPDDSGAMLEAIRELAEQVQSLQERLTILDADVDDLRSNVRHIEDQADSK